MKMQGYILCKLLWSLGGGMKNLRLWKNIKREKKRKLHKRILKYSRLDIQHNLTPNQFFLPYDYVGVSYNICSKQIDIYVYTTFSLFFRRPGFLNISPINPRAFFRPASGRTVRGRSLRTRSTPHSTSTSKFFLTVYNRF